MTKILCWRRECKGQRLFYKGFGCDAAMMLRRRFTALRVDRRLKGRLLRQRSRFGGIAPEAQCTGVSGDFLMFDECVRAARKVDCGRKLHSEIMYKWECVSLCNM